MFVTERVELNCTLEGSSAWRFTWFRDSKEIPDDGATLSIPTASTEHAGQYMCRGDDFSRNLTTHDSDEFTLKVNGGSTVFFWCFKDRRGISCTPCHHTTVWHENVLFNSDHIQVAEINVFHFRQPTVLCWANSSSSGLSDVINICKTKKYKDLYIKYFHYESFKWLSEINSILVLIKCVCVCVWGGVHNYQR